MSGKERKVYFYAPYFYDEDDDQRRDVPDRFWEDLLNHIETLSSTDRLKRINGLRYRGATRSTSTPAVRFLYIGKRRPKQDWPDQSVNDADELPLEMDGELVEPMYLLPVHGTNYLAILRSSGGPSFAAAIEWIGQVLLAQGSKYSFEMQPVVRGDGLERLKESLGAVMYDIRLEPGGTVPDGAGPITNVVRELHAEAGSDISIGLRVSFGNVRPNDDTAKAIAKDVEKVVAGGHGVRKAMARVIESGDDGSTTKDTIEFFKERMATTVPVGRSESQVQTPEVVMTAMTSAITMFKENLTSIRNAAQAAEGEVDNDHENELGANDTPG